MILSASSVATYGECHLQWYFTYVERRPAESEAMALGQEIHDYAEAILRNGLPYQGVACGICEMLPHSPQCPRAGDEASRLLEVFIADIYPTYRDPVLIEAAFELDVDGVTYTGFIDSVDVHDFTEGPPADEEMAVPGEAVILRDLKTSKSRPRKGQYRDPLIGYYLGARELSHEPDIMQLDYIVKTKKPYYWPEVRFLPDDDEIDIWAAQVVQTARLIEEADWNPTGVGTYVCASCPHKDICGPYDRWLEMTSPIREEAR